MLGIGQIANRIAELIRGAMPFAIVSNGTNPDGTSRGMSSFEKIMCYNGITEASLAGKNLIFVREGRYTQQVLIKEDYRLIIGSHDAIIYTNDTHIAWHQTSTATSIVTIGLTFLGKSGGTGGFRTMQLDGVNGAFIFGRFGDADTTKVLVNSSSSQNWFVGCVWNGTVDGGWLVQCSGGYNKFIGCKSYGSGNHGVYIPGTQSNIIVGNTFQGTTVNVQLDSSSAYNIVACNQCDASITNNSGTSNNVIANNAMR